MSVVLPQFNPTQDFGIVGTPSLTGNASSTNAVIAPNGWSLGLPGQPNFFDAWLTLRHSATLTATKHPVETGAEITDHSYTNPETFSFEILMSDIANPLGNQWGTNFRGVHAYNTLIDLQNSR